VTRAALLLVAISLLPLGARADTRAELWTELGAEVEPVEDLELSWSNHWRFVDGPGELDRWLNDVGLRYRFNKTVRVGAGYRLIYRPFRATPCCRHRPHVQATLQAKVGKLRFAMRGRAQVRLELGEEPRWDVRDRLSVSWRGVKILRPFVSAEVFVRLADGDDIARMKTARFDVGWQFRGVPHVKLTTYYRLELPGDPTDDTLHIVGLEAKAY
jgi:hypothetical protein